jgi:pimeloyl-ACP methyl ester carboxylesterase
MPIRQINADQNYYLINFDGDGKERAANDGSLLSALVLDELKNHSVTDVFVMSHGWLGDIDDAQEQYDRWMANLWNCSGDLDAVKNKRPNFKPLLIGLHWPSKPFGEEDTGGAFAIDLSAGGDDIVNDAVANQLALLNASDEIRPQLETIFKAYLELDEPETLPDEVQNAYLQINNKLGLDGEDRDPFDPEEIFQNALEADQEGDEFGSFGGGFSWGDLLAPLRVLSFWRMKGRARSVGESGANELLRTMQGTGSGRDARFHLMGHSFGCIVVTAMAAGSSEATMASNPVHSLMLVQGAMSLWAYAARIPHALNKAGAFNRLVNHNRVKGAILTTLSEHDSAVGFFYPLAAGLKWQMDFAAELPKYGAIGAFGLQGLDDIAEGLTIGNKDHQYNFRAGRIYNLESSGVIRERALVIGAHSDIAHPEVAHAWWQAVMVD